MELTAPAGQGVPPWLGTRGLRAGLPGLGVCEEQKGEARSQQDAPGPCITHGAVVPLKGAGETPLCYRLALAIKR